MSEQARTGKERKNEREGIFCFGLAVVHDQLVLILLIPQSRFEKSNPQVLTCCYSRDAD